MSILSWLFGEYVWRCDKCGKTERGAATPYWVRGDRWHWDHRQEVIDSVDSVGRSSAVA